MSKLFCAHWYIAKSDRRKEKPSKELHFDWIVSFSQYGEDDEDEQSEDGDGSTSPRPFDR